MASRQASSAEVALEVMAALIARVEDENDRLKLQRQADALARLLAPEDDFTPETYLQDEVLRALAD